MRSHNIGVLKRTRSAGPVLLWVLMAVVGWVGTPAAAADEVPPDSVTASLLPPADMVVDRAGVWNLSGYLNERPASVGPPVKGVIYTYISPASEACGPTHARGIRNPGTIDFEPVPTQTGMVRGGLVWTPKTAGVFAFCVYLADLDPAPPAPEEGETLAAASVPVTVRNPRANLQIAVAGTRFPVGSAQRVAVTARAEVPRQVQVAINPANSACGPQLFANPGIPVVQLVDIGDDVHPRILADLSRPVAAVDAAFTTPAAAGRFHLCGFIASGSGDTTPIATAESAPFWVGPATCQIGPVPRRASRPIRVTCSNTEGQITIRATRGKRVISKVRLLANGVATISAGNLGLSARRSSQVAVLQDGTELVGVKLRLRR